MQAKQAAHSSGVTARISQRTDIDDNQAISSYFVVATRALNRKPEAIELLKEVMEHSVFGEHDRIKEILQQRRPVGSQILQVQGMPMLYKRPVVV